MSSLSSVYAVLASGVEVRAEVERKKSRFLAVLRQADSAEEAQAILDDLRRDHHTARHHCSAWAIGPDRRIQRANDDGEPSGTAGAPMLEALTKAQMPTGEQDLSDVVAVVVRWFGGTLLGAGGLVSAYSDAVLAALGQAEAQEGFVTRQRMRQFTLAAPIVEAGRWENELRGSRITVLGTDYAASPGSAVLNLAVADDERSVAELHRRTASLSSGSAELSESGLNWVDAQC